MRRIFLVIAVSFMLPCIADMPLLCEIETDRNFPVFNNDLSPSKIVVIDPGHGATKAKPPKGVQYRTIVIGKQKLYSYSPMRCAKEIETVLKFSLLLQAEINRQSGGKIKCVLTRTRNDEFPSLSDRVKIVKGYGSRVRAFVSIHTNDTRSCNDCVCTSKERGVEAYYYRSMNKPFASRLGKLVSTVVSGGKKIPFGFCKQRNLYVLKHCPVSVKNSVLLELGYHSNTQDYKLLSDPKYLATLATKLAQEILTSV